jgi:hypothetical protein
VLSPLVPYNKGTTTDHTCSSSFYHPEQALSQARLLGELDQLAKLEKRHVFALSE